jgi:hypothetical protein
VIISQGKHQRVQVSTYSSSGIAALAAQPELIAAWRREDQQSIRDAK